MSQATLRDLCAEAINVDGTGDATFHGALRGHRTFADAYAGALPLSGVRIKIEEANAQGYIVRWEDSECTVSEAGFTRDTCINSSNNGAFEEFGAGYKRAFVFIPVSDVGGGGSSTIVGITGTKSEFNTALTDGNFAFSGDAPTAHNQAWSTITSTPTTLSGYGITDGGGMSIGGTVTGGTAGRVPYIGAGVALAQDAGFNYDTATHSITLGTLNVGGNDTYAACGIAARGGYTLIESVSGVVVGYDTSSSFGVGAIAGTARFEVHPQSTTKVGQIIQLPASAAAAALQVKNIGGTVITQIKVDGSLQPASLADAAATNNSTYLSTDSGKLSYKDAGGTVHALHA